MNEALSKINKLVSCCFKPKRRGRGRVVDDDDEIQKQKKKGKKCLEEIEEKNGERNLIKERGIDEKLGNILFGKYRRKNLFEDQSFFNGCRFLIIFF